MDLGHQEGREKCAVQVAVAVAANLAHVRIVGNLTGPGLMQAKACALADLAELGPVAGWFVDYTDADVRLTRAELAAVFDAPEDASQVAMPAAMLVRPRDLPLFEGHIWDVAWRGVVRQVFTCRTQALAWLTQLAASAAEDRALPEPG